MSAEPDFDAIYRLLGVAPDQGWDAVRKAYRQRAQALHPDKVSGDARLVKLARRRFEQLNGAYRELKRYRDIFGGLPPVDLNVAAAPDSANRSRVAPEPMPRRGSRLLRWVVVLGLAAAPAVWYLAQRVPAPDRGPPPIPEPRPPAVERPRITLGSTLGQVLDIQGQPDRVDEQTWHYGASSIRFEDGRVVSWESRGERPLQTVTLRPDVGSAPAPAPLEKELIALGASKADVARIQGTPLRADDHEWDYGVSKVYFEDGRVSGWFNSPVDPLRVRGPYGRQRAADP